MYTFLTRVSLKIYNWKEQKEIIKMALTITKCYCVPIHYLSWMTKDSKEPSTQSFYIFELKCCRDILLWITLFWRLLLKLFISAYIRINQLIYNSYLNVFAPKNYFFFIASALVVSYSTPQCYAILFTAI